MKGIKNAGKLKNLASATGAKSTNPTHTADIYPDTIPN